MNKLDDIIIWDKKSIQTIRNNNKFTNNFKNLNDIFIFIIKLIKKKGMQNYVLILNKSIKVSINFLNLLNSLNITNDFEILLTGNFTLNKNENTIKYNKILSLGSFILNVKNVDLNNLNLTEPKLQNYPTKIYSNSEPLTVNPVIYKKLYLLRETTIVKKFKSINIEFFRDISNLIIKDHVNPFLNVSQVKISKSLHLFSDRFKKNFNLKEYNDKFKPCLFFGIYREEDLEALKNHEGIKYIIWGGSDINIKLENHSKIISEVMTLNIDEHFAISKDIQNRLKQLDKDSKLVYFDLVDDNLFKPIKNYGDKIYIYNGFKKGRENIYGKKVYDEVVKRIPEFEYIYSNDLNLSYEKMPDIYRKCFIGLRLTEDDGNANTVQELEKMNIPIIHNGDSKYAKKWKNVDDVELEIRYTNIDLFNDSIKDYKNILFICSDFPNHGGAATNTSKLIKYYKSIGKNVYGIFHTNDEYFGKIEDENIDVISKSDLKSYLHNLDFKPDLIILRNYLNFNIKSLLKCKVYFLIPGIFGPNLTENYKVLSDDKLKKYINKEIIKTIKYSDLSYCASNHTKEILERIYNIKTKILFFNYIPFYKRFIEKDINFDKREYDYGIIVSDFNRKIKNTDYLINKLKFSNKKVVLVGKNSDKYKEINNFTVYSDISHESIFFQSTMYNLMKKIKVLLLSSFYESCSNVYVEGRFNGCEFQNDVIIGNINFREDIIKDKLDKLIKMNRKIILNNILLENNFIKSKIDSEAINESNSNQLCINNNKINYLYSITKERKIEKESKIIEQKLIKKDIDKDLKKKLLIKKNKKILITSTQYPYNGGAATCSYHSIKYLRDLGYDVIGIYFDNTKNINIDPKNYGNIIQVKINNDFTLRVEKDYYVIKNFIIKNFGRYPDFIYAWNYGAPIISRNIFRHSKIIYVITGLPTVTLGKNSCVENNISINKLLTDSKKELLNNELLLTETKCIEISDLCLPYTNLIKVFFEKFYSNYLDKLCDSLNNAIGNIIFNTEVYKEKKEIDLIAASSNWFRKVKNLNFLLNIYSKYPNLKKYIIGLELKEEYKSKENIELFQKAKSIKNLTILKRIDYNKLQKFIAKSKLLLVTSYSESGPNVIVEAYLQNCQVLSTKNIGLYNYLQSYAICKDVYNIDEWYYKINYIIDHFKNLTVPDLNLLEKKERINLIDFIENKITYPKSVNIKNKNKIVFITIDLPFVGGASTNTINLYNNLKDIYDCYIIFISDDEYLDKIDNEKFNVLKFNELDKIIDIKKNFEITDDDLIFYKNYKIFYSVHKYFKNNINIFSPSGLRNLTKKISLTKNWVLDIKKSLLFNTQDELDLENYAFSNCDMILPNSKLTYELMSNTIFSNKLEYPIYLTNINYNLKKKRKNYFKRKYDLAFICYDWKRVCKNYDLVLEIIDNKKLIPKKICIIGKNQKKYENENIDSFDNLNKEEMNNIMNDIKIIAIPSLYDSNPNVLIEGVNNGCNIVTSKNVGNNEYLRDNLIVVKYDNINHWIAKINNCLKSYAYYGALSDVIKNDLCLLFNKVKNIKKKINQNDFKNIDFVGVYKIPAEWDNFKINGDFKDIVYLDKKINNINEHSNRQVNINNIYFDIFNSINRKKKFKNTHFIYIDIYNKVNYHFLKNNINIWVVNDISFFNLFKNAKYYFLRGNYHNFYSQILNKDAFSIFYPATSFKFSYNFSKKVQKKLIKKKLEVKKKIPDYSLVLVHEDDFYRKVYKNSKLLLFNKFSGDNFYFKNLERVIDIIYVADATQPTKNHNLMFDFIRYCEEKEFSLKIAYISNKDILKEKYDNFIDNTNLKVIKLEYYNNINFSQLNDLYNMSKINLILSGRDCCPRVISESLNCGCYNICLDTLSDGKFYYTDILGNIISLPNLNVVNIRGSLCYEKNMKIFFKIIYLTYYIDFDHEMISIKFKKMFGEDIFINKLVKHLK